MQTVLSSWLCARWLPLYLALLGMLLCLPGLDVGLQVDDNFHKLALSDPPLSRRWSRSPAALFVFFNGDPTVVHKAMDSGAVPWWSAEELRLAFFRPLSGVTHWADHRWWPDHPWLMHLQSILWYGAAVGAAALLFRRLLGPGWTAGVAGVLFAVDDGHGMAATWLANRNAVIALLFGVLTLHAHHCWRQRHSMIHAAVAPALLLCSLLANEGGAAICAYLLAYALFLDTGSWRARLLSLAPAGVVAGAWLLVYRAAGFGASFSGVYLDPGDPLRFLIAVIERGPLLLAGQLGLPLDLHLSLATPAHTALWVVAVLLLIGCALLLAPLLRRDPAVRFAVVGMALAVLPTCSTFPASRTLVFASIGGAMVLAKALAALTGYCRSHPCGALQRRGVAALTGIVVLVHLVLAPLGLLATGSFMKAIGEVITRAAASLPEDCTEQDMLLAVNAPSAFLATHGPLPRLLQGSWCDARLLVLGSSIHQTAVTTRDQHSLLIRPEGGWLAPRGTRGTHHHSLFDPMYGFQLFDYLYRDEAPWQLQHTVTLTGVTIVVTALTPDRRPAAATFRFTEPLAHPTHRWLQWSNGVWKPFVPPPVGEMVVLPPITLPKPGA